MDVERCCRTCDMPVKPLMGLGLSFTYESKIFRLYPLHPVLELLLPIYDSNMARKPFLKPPAAFRPLAQARSFLLGIRPPDICTARHPNPKRRDTRNGDQRSERESHRFSGSGTAEDACDEARKASEEAFHP